MLIGRKKEIELLDSILQSDNSHFVAVYGRRRIGKTFLIREFFGYRFTFQHAGLSESGMKEQLFAFASSLKDAGCAVARNPKNWLEAFEGLKSLVRESNEKRKVIFIDELSWMLSKVVHNKGGLYNRLTEQIHLQTFTLKECEEYVKAAGLALNRNQILQYYMIFGGVPYYWGF